VSSIFSSREAKVSSGVSIAISPVTGAPDIANVETLGNGAPKLPRKGDLPASAVEADWNRAEPAGRRPAGSARFQSASTAEAGRSPFRGSFGAPLPSVSTLAISAAPVTGEIAMETPELTFASLDEKIEETFKDRSNRTERDRRSTLGACLIAISGLGFYPVFTDSWVKAKNF